MIIEILFWLLFSVVTVYFVIRKMILWRQKKKLDTTLRDIGRCRAGGVAIVNHKMVYRVDKEFDSGMAAMEFLEKEMQARSREASFGKIVFAISNHAYCLVMDGELNDRSLTDGTIYLELWVAPIK